jgi:hypothetical protein
MSAALAGWHAYIESGDPQTLSDLLDDDRASRSWCVR